MPINFEFRGKSLLSGIAMLLAGGLALIFSVTAFLILSAVALVFGGWFWWKTRALRRAMRDQMQDWPFPPEAPPGETVIDGEAVRVDDDPGIYLTTESTEKDKD